MSNNLKKPKLFLWINKNQQLLLENDNIQTETTELVENNVNKNTTHQNLWPSTVLLQTYGLKGIHLMKNSRIKMNELNIKSKIRKRKKLGKDKKVY